MVIIVVIVIELPKVISMIYILALDIIECVNVFYALVHIMFQTFLHCITFQLESTLRASAAR